VHRCLVQGGEHGPEREVALGVASAAGHRMIVEQQTGDLPAEAPQDVPERLAHQTMGAHHPGQRWIMLALVTESLRLRPRRQHRDPPDTGVPGHRRDHVVAHWTQEGVCRGARGKSPMIDRRSVRFIFSFLFSSFFSYFIGRVML